MKLLPIFSAIFALQLSTFAFEGRIAATITQGTETRSFLYTAGADHLRIERTETNWPHPVNIASLNSDELALIYPHNRSFVQLRSTNQTDQSAVSPYRIPVPQSSPNSSPAVASTPSLRPAIGPTNLQGMPAPPTVPTMALPSNFGAQARFGSGAMPTTTMPMIPAAEALPAELKATGETTNILGYFCSRFEAKQRGETVEIWATDKLLPFQPWLQNQPRRFGPRMIEEQWGEVLKAKKLFPLRAVLKFENGPERFRFEVQSVTPEKIKKEDEAKLFQPPTDYQEIQPLAF